MCFDGLDQRRRREVKDLHFSCFGPDDHLHKVVRAVHRIHDDETYILVAREEGATHRMPTFEGADAGCSVRIPYF